MGTAFAFINTPMTNNKLINMTALALVLLLNASCGDKNNEEHNQKNESAQAEQEQEVEKYHKYYLDGVLITEKVPQQKEIEIIEEPTVKKIIPPKNTVINSQIITTPPVRSFPIKEKKIKVKKEVAKSASTKKGYYSYYLDGVLVAKKIKSSKPVVVPQKLQTSKNNSMTRRSVLRENVTRYDQKAVLRNNQQKAHDYTIEESTAKYGNDQNRFQHQDTLNSQIIESEDENVFEVKTGTSYHRGYSEYTIHWDDKRYAKKGRGKSVLRFGVQSINADIEAKIRPFAKAAVGELLKSIEIGVGTSQPIAKPSLEGRSGSFDEDYNGNGDMYSDTNSSGALKSESYYVDIKATVVSIEEQGIKVKANVKTDYNRLRGFEQESFKGYSDFGDGKIIYNDATLEDSAIDYDIDYLVASTGVKFEKKWRNNAKLTVGLNAGVFFSKDEDTHRWRGKTAKSEAFGYTVGASVGVEYPFYTSKTAEAFVFGSAEVEYRSGSGTQDQVSYWNEAKNTNPDLEYNTENLNGAIKLGIGLRF